MDVAMLQDHGCNLTGIGCFLSGPFIFWAKPHPFRCWPWPARGYGHTGFACGDV